MNQTKESVARCHRNTITNTNNVVTSCCVSAVNWMSSKTRFSATISVKFTVMLATPEKFPLKSTSATSHAGPKSSQHGSVQW